MRKRLVLLGVCSYAVSSGCTGLEPAMVGAALSGAQTGVTLLAGAEVWAFEEVPFEDVIDAVQDAGERLGLTVLNEKQSEKRYWVYFRYGGNQKLEVEVKPQTSVVTSIEIDTRNKDQQGMATLFLERVFEAMPGAAPVIAPGQAIP